MADFIQTNRQTISNGNASHSDTPASNGKSTQSIDSNGKSTQSIASNGKTTQSIDSNGKTTQSIVSNGKNVKALISNGKQTQILVNNETHSQSSDINGTASQSNGTESPISGDIEKDSESERLEDNQCHLTASRSMGDPLGRNNKPSSREFLVSFLVDARGGAMTGSRRSGLRIVIPPRAAGQPVRVTCRHVQLESLLHPPSLTEGEGLGCLVLQLTPAHFLSPVLLEVPHFTPSSPTRELVVLRCDNGRKWTPHNNATDTSTLTAFLNQEFNKNKEQKSQTGIARITTTDLPQYFAVVSRPKQELATVGPEGGVLCSPLEPLARVVFPSRSLTKRVPMGVSLVFPPSSLVQDISLQGGAVSPILTIEPRRRKFHRAITVSLPVPPKQKLNNNNNNQIDADIADSPIEMTLMLLCSMSSCGARASWEDVTLSTPLSFSQDCVQFTTIVSASFWLVNLPSWMVADSITLLDKLYRRTMRVPYLGRMFVLWRPLDILAGDEGEAEIRILIATDGERVSENTLEEREMFMPLFNTQELSIPDQSKLMITVGGNLLNVGEDNKLSFKAFSENRSTLVMRRHNRSLAAAGTLDLLLGDEVLHSAALRIPLGKDRPTNTPARRRKMQ